MPEGVDLICAATGCTAEEAAAVLGRAETLGVDPFDLLGTNFGINDTLLHERAARWCGLAYSSVIPDLARLPGEARRVDTLAHVRSLRLVLFDREILFAAPRFRQMLALAEQVRADPDIRRRICLVPPRELRRALAQRFSTGLVDYARQNLSRIWPFATAHLDLGLPLRLGFVFALATLLILAVVAPFWARPVLVPLLFVLLVLPAWFRIVAIIDEPDPSEDRKRRLCADVDLPVYSVLVPLRDEAHMVPQLVQSLSRLDYPALCIKRTKA